MIIVLGIVMILSIVGVAVMTFSANNNQSSTVEKQDYELYYVGKSTLGEISSSLKNGDVGDKIKKEMYDNKPNVGESFSDVSKKYLDSSIILDSNELSKYEFSDFNMDYIYDIQNQSLGTEIESSEITVKDTIVNISFIVTDTNRGESQKFASKFSYKGTYVDYEDSDYSSSGWTDEEWVLQSL